MPWMSMWVDESGQNLLLCSSSIVVFRKVISSVISSAASVSMIEVLLVTLTTTKQAVYLFGFKTGMTGELLVWKLEEEVFSLLLSVPQFNPVSITSISNRGLYIGVATKHIVGSPQPETIKIYRFNEETLELIEEQSVLSVSPKKVVFATLPSAESVLYVLSDNPASPLEVFLYRGIEGYKRFMVEATLPIPKDIQVFTDHNKKHFVIVDTEVNKYVYQALF